MPRLPDIPFLGQPHLREQARQEEDDRQQKGEADLPCHDVSPANGPEAGYEGRFDQ